MEDLIGEAVRKLQRRLEPLLNELKLKICLEGYSVTFTTGEENTICPVRIWLGDNAAKFGEWSGALLEYESIHRTTLGRSGWIFNEAIDEDEIDLEDDADAFKRIEECLRANGVMHKGRNTDFVTANVTLANVFFHLENSLLPMEGTEIRCERSDEADTIVFLDWEGSLWRIAFHEDRIDLSVDGETVATCKPHDSNDVEDSIRMYFYRTYGPR